MTVNAENSHVILTCDFIIGASVLYPIERDGLRTVQFKGVMASCLFYRNGLGVSLNDSLGHAINLVAFLSLSLEIYKSEWKRLWQYSRGYLLN